MSKVITALYYGIAVIRSLFAGKEITADAALSTFNKALKKIDKVDQKLDKVSRKSGNRVLKAQFAADRAVENFGVVRDTEWQKQDRIATEQARLASAKAKIAEIIS